MSDGNCGGSPAERYELLNVYLRQGTGSFDWLDVGKVKSSLFGFQTFTGDEDGVSGVCGAIETGSLFSLVTDSSTMDFGINPRSYKCGSGVEDGRCSNFS